MNLYDVVRDGDINTLKECFSVENINKVYGNTLLHVASFGNHLEIVEFLLENGADPFQRNIQGKMSEELTRDPEILGLLKVYRKKHLKQQKESEKLRKSKMNETPPLDLEEEFKSYEFRTPSKEKNKSIPNLDFVVNERRKNRERYYSLMDGKIRENIHLNLENEKLTHENKELENEVKMIKSELDSLRRMKTEYIINKNELFQSNNLLEKAISENRTLLMERNESDNDLHEVRQKFVDLEKSFVDLRNRTLNESRNVNRTIGKYGRFERENVELRKAYIIMKKRYDEVCSQFCISTNEQ